MDCNFKQLTKEEQEIESKKLDIALEKMAARSQARREAKKLNKREWEKHFNKSWNKLSVGQQMALVRDIDGEDVMKFTYHPTNHVSNFLRDGSPIPDKNGMPQKRTWQTMESRHSNAIHIKSKRRYYDYMITKYNYPKLDRVVGAKLG